MKFPCYITIGIKEMTEKEQASKTSLHKVTDITLSQAIFFMIICSQHRKDTIRTYFKLIKIWMVSLTPT